MATLGAWLRGGLGKSSGSLGPPRCAPALASMWGTKRAVNTDGADHARAHRPSGTLTLVTRSRKVYRWPGLEGDKKTRGEAQKRAVGGRSNPRQVCGAHRLAPQQALGLRFARVNINASAHHPALTMECRLWRRLRPFPRSAR
jgi:hypothetical protein